MKFREKSEGFDKHLLFSPVSPPKLYKVVFFFFCFLFLLLELFLIMKDL